MPARTCYPSHLFRIPLATVSSPLIMTALLALLLGVVAGLRTMTPPAMLAWAAHLGWLDLENTGLAFLASIWSRGILTVAAVGELVADQLPSTPSRTVPVQFGARLVSGGFCGAAIGLGRGAPIVGAVAGVVGAIIGTLGGRYGRARLAATFRRDPPAAFLEDAVAIGAAMLIGLALR
jgi:uncharacterized membrane protein